MCVCCVHMWKEFKELLMCTCVEHIPYHLLVGLQIDEWFGAESCVCVSYEDVQTAGDLHVEASSCLSGIWLAH